VKSVGFGSSVLSAGVPFAWMTADEAYGQNGELRAWCREWDVHYVMATRWNDRGETTEGHCEVRELIRRVRPGTGRDPVPPERYETRKTRSEARDRQAAELGKPRDVEGAARPGSGVRGPDSLPP
jgi:hypothetical protein